MLRSLKLSKKQLSAPVLALSITVATGLMATAQPANPTLVKLEASLNGASIVHARPEAVESAVSNCVQADSKHPGIYVQEALRERVTDAEALSTGVVKQAILALGPKPSNDAISD